MLHGKVAQYIKVAYKHDIYGWTITTLTPETGTWLEEALGGEAINAARLREGGKAGGASTGKSGSGRAGGGKSKNRSIKYICPKCGAIIRATREVNVVCGDCEEVFERAA